MNKKQKNPYAPLEKVLTVAGIGIVILGVFTTLYLLSKSTQYMHDIFDGIYYCRYLLLLGGGFLIGILAAHKRRLEGKLFTGTVYGMFAVLIYGVADIGRVLLEDVMGTAAYPVGKMVFYGIPVFALLVTCLLAFFAERKAAVTSVAAKFALTWVFLVGQIYLIGVILYAYLTQASPGVDSNISLWVQILQTITLPVIAMLIAFLLLAKVSGWRTRLFYASYIGSFYSILFMILWEFSVDPFVTQMAIYSTILSLVSLLVAGVLLWRARAAVK